MTGTSNDTGSSAPVDEAGSERRPRDQATIQ